MGLLGQNYAMVIAVLSVFAISFYFHGANVNVNEVRDYLYFLLVYGHRFYSIIM